MRQFQRCIAVAALLLAGWAAPLPVRAAPASGHTYTVNSTLDEPDANPTDGICSSTPSGRCTLRAAIMDANHATGPNTIILPAGVFTLTRVAQDDTAVGGDLDIIHDLSLQGAGSGLTIVDGNGAATHEGVFQVLNTTQNMSFSGLTIRHGQLTTNTIFSTGGGGIDMEGAGQLQLSDVILEHNLGGYYGGGLYFNATQADPASSVVLDHVTVRDNAAASLGGGITILLYDGTSTLTMSNSQIYSNTALGDMQAGGGGIYADSFHPGGQWQMHNSQIYSNSSVSGGGVSSFAALSMSDSRVHDNHADKFGGGMMTGLALTLTRTTLDDNSAGLFGGGLYLDAAPLTLDSSTLSGNAAGYLGGGLYAYYGPATLVNSTLSGNTAHEAGGGLFFSDGQLTLLNDTIADNQVLYHLAIEPDLGGGVFLTQTVVFVARNSIIANNQRISDRGPHNTDDCSSHDSTGDLYYNVFTEMANCTILVGGNEGNFVADPLQLGPLQDNGGATHTQALPNGSPAIDAGDPLNGCTGIGGGVLAADQRGAARNAGACDLGTYEFVPEADVAVWQRASPSPARPSAPLTYTIGVTNAGPDQATSVQLIDTLPLSTTFAAASPSQGSCLGTATIVCNLGALASGAPATVTLMVTPTAAGLLTNRITVNATVFDPQLANNSADETTAVAPQADLAVSQRDSPDPVRPGAPLTYTLAVTNAGPDPAIAVVLTDTLPLSAVLATAMPSQGSCVGAVIVTCNLGSIARGDHVTLTVAVTPTAAGLMTNLVTVTANDLDPALANNSAIETTTIVALRRLYLPLVQR